LGALATTATSTPFSFGTTAPKPAATATPFSFGTSTTTTTAAATPATTAPPFSFGAAAAPATTAAAPFSFGAGATAIATPATTAAAPFSFGASAIATPATAASAAPAPAAVPFSFGAPAAATTATKASAAPAPAAAPFSFGAPAAPATTTSVAPTLPAAPFSLVAPTTTTATPANTAVAPFSFGTPATTTSASSIPFTLTSNVSAKTTLPVASLPLEKLPSASTTSSTLGSATTTTIGGTSAVKPTLTFGLGSGVAKPTKNEEPAVAPTLGLSVGATTQSSLTNQAGCMTIYIFSAPKATAPVVNVAPTSAAAAPIPASSTVTGPQNKPLTYEKLEELINKWTLDVEELERLFITQADQINSCDRALMENGDKILEFNDTIQNLENDHVRIEHEIDFVVQQQSEMNQILDQLEKLADAEMTDSTSMAGSMGYYGAVQREEMVQQQISLDSQLKQISQELEQVTDRINCFTQSEIADDPIKQISQTLAKQMDSLQWIGEQTSRLQEQVSEVRNQMDSQKKKSSFQYWSKS
uniref:Nucleoporin NSP1-like C-terminal domain-containing protein n=1 Tax=Romanomermis culicivorax TaxID=13658 RepID=A0A915HMU5_ROMCU